MPTLVPYDAETYKAVVAEALAKTLPANVALYEQTFNPLYLVLKSKKFVRSAKHPKSAQTIPTQPFKTFGRYGLSIQGQVRDFVAHLDLNESVPHKDQAPYVRLLLVYGDFVVTQYCNVARLMMQCYPQHFGITDIERLYDYKILFLSTEPDPSRETEMLNCSLENLTCLPLSKVDSRYTEPKVTSECPVCDGRGWFFDDACNLCHGTGRVAPEAFQTKNLRREG